MLTALSVHTMLKNNQKLDTYWLTFPKDPNLPFGIGVTAVSEDDAFKLIRDQGIDKWYENAQEINIQKGVRINDLDQTNVVPNIGPLQFRGVWYPVQNIGYGSPKDGQFKSLRNDDT